MDTGWKVTVSGIEARDLFYTRPFSPYSTLDKYTERFYQFLSAGVAVGVIGTIGWQAGLGAALIAGGIGLARTLYRFKDDAEETRIAHDGLNLFDELREPKVTRLKGVLNGYLHRMGIKKNVRILDIGTMFGKAAHETAMPNAVNFMVQEGDTAYLGTNRALTSILSPDEVHAVMAHEAGHQARDGVTLGTRFNKLRVFTNVAIVAGAFLANPWLLALLPAQSLIYKSYMRHEEFRADRASAYLTRQPMIMSNALGKMKSHVLGGASSTEERDAMMTTMSSQGSGSFLNEMFRDAVQLFIDHPTVERRQRRLVAMQRRIDNSQPRRRSGSGVPIYSAAQYAL